MSDVDCPYCGEEQDIDQCDGHGTDEGELYEQECRDCEKTFRFNVSWSCYHEGFKSECLNGGEHIWKPKRSSQTLYFPDYKYCDGCYTGNFGKYDPRGDIYGLYRAYEDSIFNRDTPYEGSI